MVTARHFGLRLQLFHLVAKFEPDILDPRQIFARILDAPFGFLAALLVTGHPRRFFQKNAQIVRPRLDNARNRALTDDGVGARPQASAQEQVGNVLAAHLQIIDEIIGLAVAGQHALDRQLGVLRPLAQRPAQRIVENEFNRGARHRRPAGRTVENHILHRLAA
ncbi:MAG: hypothetical protein BWY57_02349 [Betaproteobacteria bacterium ADurb.Bin341]|nr:MAG: hypothetical protein BWY57_02349 [Betaproteobacteria bacterium ADurb.Bin341]